ncbi:DJ-1/PfpI family protein [Halobium salinum]|uniref:DJ-1/PfpI family protein n=1 Tax=Halobium salinum TaxID=1364940 RepID=A0ABD5PDX3_9EURY|nr:DJ-1/PfpI family protein [Halobium salinum]
MTTTTVHVLLYDGFDELDAVGPYEVFATAAALGAAFDVRLVTVAADEDETDRTVRADRAEPTVSASHGLRVVAGDTLPGPDADDAPDLLVVPGGGWNDRSAAGAWAEYERGVVPDAVAAHHEAGATVAAVCTGGMLLAKAGLLDGRPAVTHAGAMDDLRGTAADVRADARVVDAGSVLTAGGITSGLDLALHLVEREVGADLANRVATELEYERHGVVHESE